MLALLAALVLSTDVADSAPLERDIQVGGGVRGGTVASNSWLHWPVVCSYGEHVSEHVVVRVLSEVAKRYAAIGVGGEVAACTPGKTQCFMLVLALAALHADVSGPDRTAGGAARAGAAYEQRLGSASMALRVEGALIGIRDERWSLGVGMTLSLSRRF